MVQSGRIRLPTVPLGNATTLCSLLPITYLNESDIWYVNSAALLFAAILSAIVVLAHHAHASIASSRSGTLTRANTNVRSTLVPGVSGRIDICWKINTAHRRRPTKNMIIS